MKDIIKKIDTKRVIIMNIIRKRIGKKPKIENTDRTIKKILDSKCSVSRFGDGELNLAFGVDLSFQKHSSELEKKLREILVSDKENHIVCLPDFMGDLSHLEEKPKMFWEKYLNVYRAKIYKSINMQKTYYDTQVTRLYMDYKDKSNAKRWFDDIKKIWDRRDIVIVEGEKSRLGIGNNLFENAGSIFRILCPAENAFEKYDEILNEIKKQDKSKLIILALGPTATVLAYDLADKYQAIDIGHIDIEYEWFLRGVKEKIAIENKYVNEANGIVVSDENDSVYLSQIISRID